MPSVDPFSFVNDWTIHIDCSIFYAHKHGAFDSGTSFIYIQALQPKYMETFPAWYATHPSRNSAYSLHTCAPAGSPTEASFHV